MKNVRQNRSSCHLGNSRQIALESHKAKISFNYEKQLFKSIKSKFLDVSKHVIKEKKS